MVYRNRGPHVRSKAHVNMQRVVSPATSLSKILSQLAV